jgi:hypothetical protein
MTLASGGDVLDRLARRASYSEWDARALLEAPGASSAAASSPRTCS